MTGTGAGSSRRAVAPRRANQAPATTSASAAAANPSRKAIRFGGAGVALSLLALEYASHVHINDLNRSVHAFWQSVLREPEELCSLISRTRVSMAQRRRQCAVQTDPDASPLGYNGGFWYGKVGFKF